jgi:hypothetical protein
MSPRVRAIKPLANHRLLVEFVNGEHRIFDAQAYLDRGVFRQLRDPEVFRAARSVLVPYQELATGCRE